MARPRVLLALLFLLALPRLAFPGDVPFIADEPVIVDRALDGLDAGEVVRTGLAGTRGATYGPVPTWIYQLALWLTSDLRSVALMKVTLVTALTGLAIVLLARNVAGLSPALGAFALLSPYLWFYSRDLWDNSFAIPFSAMLLAAYTEYLASERLRYLAWTALFAMACLLTHLMTTPLVGAVAIHFLVTRRRQLTGSRRFALRVVPVGLVCLVVVLSYVGQGSGNALSNLLWSPSARSLIFSLDGFRLFTLVGFDYVIGAWNAVGLGPVARLLSTFTYVVGAYGVFEVTRELRSDVPSTRREVARVLAVAFVFFILLADGERLAEHPHYYNGVWVVFFLFWWVGMSRLLARAWARRLFVAQLVVMSVFLVGLGAWLHVNHGTKSLHYGPTLGNQMVVARELDRLGVEDAPPSPAHHPRLFPQAIRVLRRLNARAGGEVLDADPPRTGYEIVYVDPDGASGEIVLRRTRDGGGGS